MNAITKIIVNNARGPRGFASGPLGAGSVDAEAISDDVLERELILEKIGALGADFSQTDTYDAGTIPARLKGEIWASDGPYNIVGDGATDCSAAFTAILNRALATGQKIVFPAGKFRFASSVVAIYTNAAEGSLDTTAIQTLVIEGAGQDATTLYFDTTDGLDITFTSQQHSFQLSSLSITTGATGARTGLRFRNLYNYFGTFVAQSDLFDVTFRGDDGYGLVKHWKECVKVSDVSNINFTGCTFTAQSDGNSGTAVNLDSPGAGTFVPPAGDFTAGTVYLFTNCNFAFIGVGIRYANNIQTVQVSNCFGAQITNLVACPSNIFNNSNQGLILNGNTVFGLGDIVVVNSPLNNIQSTGNLYVVRSGARGIFVQPCVNFSAIGDQFIPYGDPNTAAAGIEMQGLPFGSVQTIDSLTVGSGYLVGASANVTGGGGTGLNVTVAAVNDTGGITMLAINNRGSGYTSAPSISFPGGSGATFRVRLVEKVLGLISGCTFSSVTNGVILDQYCTNVMVDHTNRFSDGMTNDILDGGFDNLIGALVAFKAGKIGYAKGAGGSVTQATSKTATVTLDRPTGRILTHNASLAAGSEASFLLLNSKIGADDWVDAKTENDNYEVRARERVAGQCRIYLKNRSGGALGDVVDIRFEVRGGTIS